MYNLEVAGADTTEKPPQEPQILMPEDFTFDPADLGEADDDRSCDSHEQEQWGDDWHCFHGRRDDRRRRSQRNPNDPRHTNQDSDNGTECNDPETDEVFTSLGQQVEERLHYLPVIATRTPTEEENSEENSQNENSTPATLQNETLGETTDNPSAQKEQARQHRKCGRQRSTGKTRGKTTRSLHTSVTSSFRIGDSSPSQPDINVKNVKDVEPEGEDAKGVV